MNQYYYVYKTIDGELIGSHSSIPNDKTWELVRKIKIGWVVERKIGKPLRFSKEYDSRKICRGNPLLVHRRFKTMEDVNKRLREW